MATRQRRHPADYGPFSSPHGSFDDPVPFPPYAELPFTSLRRRRQLQDNHSFVKWAMRAVLLSPVVVLVLWSVAAVMFANTHQVGHIKNNNNSFSSRRQSRQNNRLMAHYADISNAGFMVDTSQQQLQKNSNLLYNVNGNAMMMAPQQPQQPLQLTNVQMMQPQGKPIPVMAPLGNGLNSNVISSKSFQQVQQQVLQQVPQQTGASLVAQPQRAYMTTNEVSEIQTPDLGQHQQMLQMNLDSSANVMKQPSRTEGAAEQFQQPPLEASSKSIVEGSTAMQRDSRASLSTQDQLQASPAKQSIYYYDPKDTKMSLAGEILQMPTIVYDAYGKAVPLAELQHKAPIYVQAPTRGDSLSSSTESDVAGAGATDSDNLLVSSPSRGVSLVSPSSREASISIPQSWGTSTSQDQTIIVATVAVMALLVGALSARRLRSKSFLSSCIENETLEDDVAYDDAYTTTAAASGAMGADSSYNTFGGWKGDLEKFDV